MGTASIVKSRVLKIDWRVTRVVEDIVVILQTDETRRLKEFVTGEAQVEIVEDGPDLQRRQQQHRHEQEQKMPRRPGLL